MDNAAQVKKEAQTRKAASIGCTLTLMQASTDAEMYDLQIRLGTNDTLPYSNKAKESRDKVVQIGKKAARGDEALYDCATDYINMTHRSVWDRKVVQILKDTMAAEQNRMMLEALKNR